MRLRATLSAAALLVSAAASVATSQSPAAGDTAATPWYPTTDTYVAGPEVGLEPGVVWPFEVELHVPRGLEPLTGPRLSVWPTAPEDLHVRVLDADGALLGEADGSLFVPIPEIDCPDGCTLVYRIELTYDELAFAEWFVGLDSSLGNPAEVELVVTPLGEGA